MKNVYLIMTDLHYAEHKANRVNYLGEILDLMQNILGTVGKYRECGYSVRVIFLGDVVDSSMSSPEEAMRATDLLRFFISNFDEAYSVVGNHEEGYVSNNPFWYLVSQIEDKTLESLPRAMQPKSILPCLILPDIVVDGEVTFYFNHYGIQPKAPKAGGIPIGLFHQNVGSNDICKMWGTFDNVEDASYVQAYRYCFFGHMHLAYGKYFLNEQHTCQCEWLGSCGRVNVLEVENAPLEVNVPAVIIEDGRFVGIEDHYIKRLPASECINYEKVNLIRETAKQLEGFKAAVPQGVISSTLLDSVKDSAKLAGLSEIIEMLLGSYDTLLLQYKQGLEQVTESSFVLKDIHQEEEGDE